MSTYNFSSRTGRFVLLALLSIAGSALAVGTAVSGSIKPKNGAYVQYPKKAGQSFGYVSTEGGKIAGAGGALPFRDKEGKNCVPQGLYAAAGKVSFVFVAKRKVRPDRRNRFTISVKPSSLTPTLKGTVKGRMLSRNRATITFALSAGSCKAKGTFGKATYTAGG
jgi:hypothetical protein